MNGRTIVVKVMRDIGGVPVAFEAGADGLADARHVAICLAGGLGLSELVSLEPIDKASALGPDAWEATPEELHAESIDAEIKALRLANLRRKANVSEGIDRVIGIVTEVMGQRRREGRPVEGREGFAATLEDALPLAVLELERMAGGDRLQTPEDLADREEERAVDAVNTLIAVQNNNPALIGRLLERDEHGEIERLAVRLLPEGRGGTQIDKLANFLLGNELLPIENEGAGDTAIRVIEELRAKKARKAKPAPAVDPAAAMGEGEAA